MLAANTQFYSDFIDDTEDVAIIDLSDIQDTSLDDFLEPFKTNDDMSVSSPSISSSYTQSPPTSSYINQSTSEQLQMVEQPFHNSKLRYRADYVREKGRVGALGNKNEKSKRKGPAVRIPDCYVSSNEYFIRVSLVTIKYYKTNLHYFHPYELEHPKTESFNDRQNNSVWFPIEAKDSIKNFPLLRIVKKKAFHVQKLTELRVFDSHIQDNQTNSPKFLSKEIDIIKEYNLEKSQLAFTLGKKVLHNGQLTMQIYPNTTIFSDPMDENDERQSDTDTDTESSSDKTTSIASNHHIYKYAPRSSIIGNNDEILVFLKKKLEQKKYGDLQVIFECDTSNGHWSQSIFNLDIKDRMISFKTPHFPYPIIRPTNVDIVLRQDNRMLGVLKYTYLPVQY